MGGGQAGAGGSGAYLVPDGRSLRIGLGLRTLDLDDWLEVDESYRTDLAEKERLLAERHNEVVAVLPEADRAAREAAAAVQEWMLAHHPTLAVRTLGAVHPLEAAARIVQEDLCVLTPSPQGLRLTAAVVCFPSRWRLRDKMGATVAGIHQPVPDYSSIRPIVDASMARLDVRRPMWRLNWTIVDDPALFLPPRSASRSSADPADPAATMLRVERQTLRRLPVTQAVLFTIRTYLAPLRQVAESPEAAARLGDSLRTASPELVRYKGWTDLLPVLLTWLAQQARHAGP
jgi:hypothetical protein